jgi:hypothetical protein
MSTILPIEASPPPAGVDRKKSPATAGNPFLSSNRH